jgi:hypothetical protein
MTKLSDTQLVILTAACQRDDRLILPLPDRLKGGAAAKVVDSLMGKGLVEQVDAKRGDPIWRNTGDGHGVTLVATDAAFEALGIIVEQDPATAGRTAAAVDDGELVGGTPADQGKIAARIEAKATARKERLPPAAIIGGGITQAFTSSVAHQGGQCGPVQRRLHAGELR